MRTLRFLLVAIMATLVLAACSREEPVTAEQIMDGMRQTRETTRDAHFVAEVNTSGMEENGRFVLEAWMRKSDQRDAAGKEIAQSRIKVLEASKNEMVGTELINNGETIWIYNPSENKVITGQLADLKNGDMGGQDPTAQMMRMQEQLQQILDGSDVKIVADNETVAGRAAWQVTLTPKPETAEQMQLGSVVKTTLWIGKDRYIPLKANLDAGDLGKLDGVVREIQLDEGVDAALFTFTPPAGAEIVDAAELARDARPQTTTLDDARANASFPLLVPEPLPDGVTLDEVQTLRMGGETVIQNYSGTLSFSLVQSKADQAMNERNIPSGVRTATVTVRGQTGTLITGGEQGSMLRWKEGGITIIIAGTLNADQVQAVAASLK